MQVPHFEKRSQRVFAHLHYLAEVLLIFLEQVGFLFGRLHLLKFLFYQLFQRALFVSPLLGDPLCNTTTHDIVRTNGKKEDKERLVKHEKFVILDPENNFKPKGSPIDIIARSGLGWNEEVLRRYGWKVEIRQKGDDIEVIYKR